MIWFTSDLHYGHSAVLNMQARPFKDVEEMNRTLIRNWNAMVSKKDTVYILGDLAHRCPVETINAVISKLNGKKILIKGNHDKEYDSSLFEGIYDFLELKGLCDTTISLMHYPMLEWPKSRHGSIHLHGHQHNDFGYNEDMKRQGILRYDVGVDAHDFYPVSLNQILEFMNISK